VELVDGADDDGVVEAEVFAADGAVLVGAWEFSLVGVLSGVAEKLLAYRSIL
jgi:hypothetical protein